MFKSVNLERIIIIILKRAVFSGEIGICERNSPV